jgi:DNA-binding PadR family transcriptional regulator
MNDARLLVLLALRERPLHGYAVQQLVAEETGRRLGPGTLYGAIAQLESDGLIAAVPARDSHQLDRRRVYRITPAGHKEAADKLESMARVIAWSRSGALT